CVLGRGRQRSRVAFKVCNSIAPHGDKRPAAFRPECCDDVGGSRSTIKPSEDGPFDLKSVHQSDHVERNRGLLAIPECSTGKEVGYSVSPLIGNDDPVTRGYQQRSNVDIAENVIGPAVQKNDGWTVAAAEFRVSNIQNAGVDLLKGTE